MKIRRKKVLVGLMAVFCLTTLVAAQLMSNYLSATWDVSATDPLIVSWVDQPNPSLEYYQDVNYVYSLTLENTDYRNINGTAIMFLSVGLESAFDATLNGTLFNPSNPVAFMILGNATVLYHFIISFNVDGNVSLSIHFDGDLV